MFSPLISIKNVSAVDPNPLPTDPYPYFDDADHQWVFENNLNDTGMGAVDYYLTGTAIYNSSNPLIRSGTYCLWSTSTNWNYNTTFLDSFRTDYGSSGWGLSIWYYYVSGGQAWKSLVWKQTDSSPNNEIALTPAQAVIRVDGTLKVHTFSPGPIVGAWNHVIMTQNSSGYFWIYMNGVLRYENGDLTDVPSDADGSKSSFFVGGASAGTSITALIDDIRFYAFDLNQTYVDFLWTAREIPSVGDWHLDADTELWNDNITISDGSIIIGLNSPTRETNFTMYNTNVWFNSSENEEGIRGNGTRMNFVNFTDVGLYNATDKWQQHDLYYFLELHLTRVYIQHVGNDAGNKEGLRIVPGSVNNVPIRFNGLTIYDSNGTALAFYGCDVEENFIASNVNITRFTNNGINVGTSQASALQRGTWEDVYTYTDLPSDTSFQDYSENIVITNYTGIGSTFLTPHKLYDFKGVNATIIASTFLDCDNGIYIASTGTVRVYDSLIDNCLDGLDAETGTIYFVDSIISNTRDRVISMDSPGATFYVVDCTIIDTVEGQHDLYYARGNLTLVNTAVNQPWSIPSGNFLRNIYQHWNFSTSDVYVNCTTVDDESNLNVAVQSATWLIESEVPKLTIEVDAPAGTSEIIVYCGENGIPSSIYVKGIEIDSWSYDSSTLLATITVTHSSEETIIVFWSDLATMGSIVGGTLILLLVGILMFGVLLMSRRR